MAMKVIKIIGLADGQASSFEGMYVGNFDPSHSPPLGHWPQTSCILDVTPRKDEAKAYNDAAAAWEDWRRIDERLPTRPDGKPNRPLTAFTVEIEDA